ncbi:MAG: hypothetical protein GF405_11110 [Candidatus Eisenbacteria bacterium]|nr:hypothetical protein [Candidatus Eisenbacteria bacterium]
MTPFTNDIDDRTMRRALQALTVGCIAVSLAIGLSGTGPRDARWNPAQIWSTPSTRAFELEGGAWGDIELAASLPQFASIDVLEPGGDRPPVLAMSDYSRDGSLQRSILTWTVAGVSGDTLAVWPGRWLVSSLPQRYGLEGDLLLWFPETWYEDAGPEMRADTVALFRHNYAMSYKLLDLDALRNAVRAAARGEMASVYSRLIVAGLDGGERNRIAFDPRYTADVGFLFDTAHGPLAIVETDGGYANSDLFYLLLDQPTLKDGEAVAITDSDDIEGSYRGFFVADLARNEALWYRRLGASSVRYHPVDLDRDGVDEILVETYCAENGVSGGGTTDAGTAYLLCLDQGGNILWRRRVLGVHNGVQCAAADFVGDGDLEIAMVWSSGRYEESGGAAVIDARGEVLAVRTDLGGLYAIAAADFDGDGRVEFATSGPDCRVAILNGALEIEQARPDTTDLLRARPGTDGGPQDRPFQGTGLVWRRRAMPIGACDVDGDGREDLVCLQTAWHRWDVTGVRTVWCGRGDIVIYDHELDVLMRERVVASTTASGRHPADAPASLKLRAFPLDADRDGRSELVLTARGHGLYFFEGGS